MPSSLSSRRVLLVISGGIAAYKSLDLIRRLREAGAGVRGLLTKGGAQFITPLSVAALSGEPVSTDIFSLTEEQRISHILLSREADVIVVAPASANLIARMAHGMADDLASTALLASDKPIMIAPAMNSAMWRHPATQANVATLRDRGVRIVGPVNGAMACGENGEGRMAEVSDIMAALEDHFAQPGPLKGLRALVTSGPTHEPIDPVRFLGNRSSGKQGHAIAAALAVQGADTVLVTGPTALPDPAGVRTIHVQTAANMLEACEAEGPYAVAVCAAAVADWRADTISLAKLKKGACVPALQLVENPDILATLSQSGARRPRLVIGFAAETHDVHRHAALKLERKGCDWILANEVGSGKGFCQDDNEVILFRRAANGQIVSDNWPRQSKEEIARKLVCEIAKTVG